MPHTFGDGMCGATPQIAVHHRPHALPPIGGPKTHHLPPGQPEDRRCLPHSQLPSFQPSQDLDALLLLAVQGDPVSHKVAESLPSYRVTKSLPSYIPVRDLLTGT